jgi:hypothetical protein
VNENLTGNYRVRGIRSAFSDVCRLCPKMKHRMEIRRHALKLRYWPKTHPMNESGQLLDLDWEWVRSLPGLHIGELRIHDAIGGHNNLRIIFYVGDQAVREPLPMIWVIQVLQKKRNDFTANNLVTFRSRRKIVIERFYDAGS